MAVAVRVPADFAIAAGPDRTAIAAWLLAYIVAPLFGRARRVLLRRR